ncbi:hypothetical protein [Streptomyces prasinus]|uniref:hypothetical protein n=2 Tax=Streptomyces prasinus TaxID=67345 RepID=UPI002F41A71E
MATPLGPHKYFADPARGGLPVPGTAVDPLRVARYAATAGGLPAGGASRARWQYASTGPVAGGHGLFHGTVDRVRAPALGRHRRPAPPVRVPDERPDAGRAARRLTSGPTPDERPDA